MPITEYDNTQARIQPTETGIDSKMQAARRIGAFYGDAGAAISSTGNRIGSAVAEAGKVYVDYVDHTEMRRGAAVGMTMFDNLSKEWDRRVNAAATTDPNDPTVAAKFKAEVLDPAVDKFKEGFSTEKSREWAENHMNTMQEHFMVKTASDMQTLAKKAVTADLEVQNNRATNAAYRQHNFSDVDYLLSSTKSNIANTVGTSNIKGVDAATATTTLTVAHQRNIVKAGMLGAIENSPNPEATAKAWIARYPDLIDGAEAGHAAKAALTQQKLNDVATKQGVLLQKQINQANSEAAGNKITSSLLGRGADGQPDGTIKPAGPEQVKALGEFLKMPDLKEGAGRAMFDFLKHEGAGGVDDKPLVNQLLTKMYDGELDPIDLVKARNNAAYNTGPGISDHTYTMIEAQRKLIQERPLGEKGFAAAMKGVDASLIVPTAISDFKLDFYPKYEALRAKGELPPGALNFRDPNSMISKALAEHMPADNEKQRYMIMKNYGMGLDAVQATQAYKGLAPFPDTAPPDMPEKLKAVASQVRVNPDKTAKARYYYNGQTYDATGKEIK